MYNKQSIVIDVLNQINVYRTMNKISNIRVFVHKTQIHDLAKAIIEKWNTVESVSISSLADLYRHFKINVIITEKPYVAPNSNHVLITCGHSDVIILETT